MLVSCSRTAGLISTPRDGCKQGARAVEPEPVSAPQHHVSEPEPSLVLPGYSDLLRLSLESAANTLQALSPPWAGREHSGAIFA